MTASASRSGSRGLATSHGRGTASSAERHTAPRRAVPSATTGDRDRCVSSHHGLPGGGQAASLVKHAAPQRGGRTVRIGPSSLSGGPATDVPTRGSGVICCSGERNVFLFRKLGCGGSLILSGSASPADLAAGAPALVPERAHSHRRQRRSVAARRIRRRCHDGRARHLTDHAIALAEQIQLAAAIDGEPEVDSTRT